MSTVSRFGIRGLGVQVSSFGCRVSGFGLRVSHLGFRPWVELLRDEGGLKPCAFGAVGFGRWGRDVSGRNRREARSVFMV